MPQAEFLHDPLAVLVDPDVLATLPEREYRSGLFEAMKYGVIRNPAIFELIEHNRDALLQYIQSQKRVTPSTSAGWRFVPWPASVVATLLAPPAAANVAPPDGVSVRPLGPAADRSQAQVLLESLPVRATLQVRNLDDGLESKSPSY